MTVGLLLDCRCLDPPPAIDHLAGFTSAPSFIDLMADLWPDLPVDIALELPQFQSIF